MVIQAQDINMEDNFNIAGSQTVLEPVPVEDAVEMEISDEDILYYIEDEDGNEIGFAIMEDGVEKEYYYAEDDECDDPDCFCHDHEGAMEVEVDEDAILYYIEDENGNEIGFAVEEDGKEVEYFYADDEPEELIDMEVDEDCILYYIEDENGNEIGFAVEEDGKEVEYFYAEEEAPAAPAAAPAAAPKDQNIFSGVRSATDKALHNIEDKLDNDDLSEGTKKAMATAADAADTMREIKGTLKEFKDAFSFKI